MSPESITMMYRPKYRVRSGYRGSPTLKNSRCNLQQETVFWDSEGVILVDFLERETAITGPYIANLIPKLLDGIKKNVGSCPKDFSCIRLMHLVSGLSLQQLQSLKQA